jgi:hypothetical protein
MSNLAITDKYYKEAVKDLNEVIFHDKDLWYSYIINLPIYLQVVYTIITFHILMKPKHRYVEISAITRYHWLTSFRASSSSVSLII